VLAIDAAVADPSLTTALLLALAGFVAGWVDAVVGGGGLIQLPAILLGLPGASPAQVLATNKFASIFGTATSSVTYYRRVRPDLRTALPMAAVAYVGAIGGALVGLMGYAFLEASAKAKIVNVATNLGALTVFAPGGHVVVTIGLVMGVANLLGGYLGARTAVRLGSRFVRIVFIVVVSAFIVRISLELLGVWG